MTNPPAQSPDAGLYVGRVMHARLNPVKHKFSYRVFSLLLDVDCIADTMKGLNLIAYNRFGLMSFFDKDHGDGDGKPLRSWIERHLRSAGIATDGGRIQLLCFPRMLGHVFNPISLYFCFDAKNRLQAMVYEVHNTFGERHAYVAPVIQGQEDITVHQHAEKSFYVSPFIGMAAHYDFQVSLPGQRFAFTIRESNAQGPLLIASQWGERRALTDANLLKAFLLHPLMTLKVVAAIYWEALRLWFKGAHYHPFKAHRGAAMTLGKGASEQNSKVLNAEAAE